MEGPFEMRYEWDQRVSPSHFTGVESWVRVFPVEGAASVSWEE